MAVVPQLCGFVPSESLVVVSLRGAAQQVGLTMRVDLPPEAAQRALAEQIADRVGADHGCAALVTVWTADAPSGAAGLPGERLVAAVARALRRHRVPTLVRLLVGSDRWWSYDCTGPCCPPEGTPLPAGATPAVDAVSAAHALAGRAVLPSRADLVSSLAPGGAAASQRLEAAASARSRRVQVEGRVAVGREALRAWRRAVDRSPGPGSQLGPEGAASLTVSLGDLLVRDEVLTWALDDDDALLSLLLQLAAASVPPYDVPVCALVAWTAHARGDGALANVALDRALAADPEHGLALLCRSALDAQVQPAQVRALLADARAVLRRQHPWTGVGTVPG